MNNRLSIFAVMAGLALGACEPGSSPLVQEKLASQPGGALPSTACKNDAECIAVPDGCCGCTGGGKQKVIHISERQRYDQDHKALYGNTCTCPGVISTDTSCSAQPACVNGSCTLGFLSVRSTTTTFGTPTPPVAPSTPTVPSPIGTYPSR